MLAAYTPAPPMTPLLFIFVIAYACIKLGVRRPLKRLILYVILSLLGGLVGVLPLIKPSSPSPSRTTAPRSR
jgi:hypothetical protein